MSRADLIRVFFSACFLLIPATGWGQAGATAPKPQTEASPEPTVLRVTSRVVEISAVVKSRDGTPKTGLTKEDFVLKQDGREEPIHYFSQGAELPLTFALLVDTSASQRTFIGDETLASDVFFQTMLGREQDRAMLVQFDTRVLQLKGMTNSANSLHLALSSLGTQPSTAGGTLLNDAVYAVAKSILASETGRKAIVILSDGGDNGSRKSAAEAIEQAERGNVQIYSILYSASDNARGLGGDAGLALLQKLSDSTGGRVFTVTHTFGLRQIFAQIAQDLRLQYEVGYTPPQELEPNSFHKLELRAKDRNLTVQARKGFFARP